MVAAMLTAAIWVLAILVMVVFVEVCILVMEV